MKNGIFITGTDTGVGKTFVSRVIIDYCMKNGIDAGYMKPVASGCDEKDGVLISPDVTEILATGGISDDPDAVCPIRYRTPASPFQASRKEQDNYDREKIDKAFSRIKQHEFVIVEGIGGLCVPITSDVFVYDLAKAFDLPLVIVAANKIGVVNHSLLTVEIARSKGLQIKGIMLNRTFEMDDDVTVASNADEIRELSGLPILGDVPFLTGSVDIEKFVDIKELLGI